MIFEILFSLAVELEGCRSNAQTWLGRIKLSSLIKSSILVSVFVSLADAISERCLCSEYNIQKLFVPKTKLTLT